MQGKSEDDEVENVNDQIECLRGIVLNSQTIMNDGPIEKKKIQNEKLVAAWQLCNSQNISLGNKNNGINKSELITRFDVCAHKIPSIWKKKIKMNLLVLFFPDAFMHIY